jgi:hypothetical protein
MPSYKDQKSYKFPVEIEVFIDEDSKELSTLWVYQTLVNMINESISEKNEDILNLMNAFEDFTSGVDVRLLVPEKYRSLLISEDSEED